MYTFRREDQAGKSQHTQIAVSYRRDPAKRSFGEDKPSEP